MERKPNKRGIDLLDVVVVGTILLILATAIITIVVSLQLCDLTKEIKEIKEQMKQEQTLEPDTTVPDKTEEPQPTEQSVAPTSEASVSPTSEVSITSSRGGSQTLSTPRPLRVRATEEEIDALAKCVYGEARGCSEEEWKMVVHTVLNRMEEDCFEDTILGNLEAPGQFVGYKKSNPVWEDIRDAVIEALQEPAPANEFSNYRNDYIFFTGDGEHNWFRR